MSKIRHQSVAPTETRYLSPGDEVTPHKHDDHQLIYASAGVLEVFVEEGTWFAPAVRAVWVPGGMVHHWQVHGTTTVHMVSIPSAYVSTLGDEPVLVSVSPLVKELIIACANHGVQKDNKARRLLHVLGDQLLASEHGRSMLPVFKDPRLIKIQKILEADMTRNLSLTELSRLAGASSRTMNRLFQSEAGMSFVTWRNQLRLHSATLMLAEGQSVTRVANDYGYSSPSAFITSFRASFGSTPGALYR